MKKSGFVLPKGHILLVTNCIEDEDDILTLNASHDRANTVNRNSTLYNVLI